MNPKKPQSLADKEAAVRKDSILLGYAYHTTPTKGSMLPRQYRNVNPELLAIFEELVESAAKYKRLTGCHLPILGELGELFAEIMFGLKRHDPMTRGSDGMLGNDFVEVKTITPDKRNDKVQVKRAGNFGKLIVVKITDDFQFGARMVHRRNLKQGKGEFDEISWDSMIAGEPNQELHRNFPFKKGGAARSRDADKTRSGTGRHAGRRSQRRGKRTGKFLRRKAAAGRDADRPMDPRALRVGGDSGEGGVAGQAGSPHRPTAVVVPFLRAAVNLHQLDFFPGHGAIQGADVAPVAPMAADDMPSELTLEGSIPLRIGPFLPCGAKLFR